jgi:hypothetical protein
VSALLASLRQDTALDTHDEALGRLTLATALDDGADMATAAVSKELCATLAALTRKEVDQMQMTQSLELTCPPKFGTPRNLDRPTFGGRAAEVAKALGKPFMPWQQHVADVALEYDPDTKLLCYRESTWRCPGRTQRRRRFARGRRCGRRVSVPDR